MLYNGVFGCHGNTCYVIFIGAIFYIIYSTGQINVCTDFEIIGSELTKLENMQQCIFYLTSRDAKTVRRTSWGLRHF